MKKILLSVCLFINGICLASPKESLFIAFQIKKALEFSSLEKYFLSNSSAEYMQSFINGMKEFDNTKNCSFIDEYHALEKLELLNFQKTAAENRSKTELWLKKLKNITWIIPEKIGYKILKTTSKQKIESLQCFATLNYTIHKINEPIAEVSQKNITLFLPQTIYGMSKAMIGMRIGETREIYVHPDYSYGIDSNFEPNIGLNIIVELLDFSLSKNHVALTLPKQNSFTPPLDEECHQCALKAFYFYGKKIWARLHNDNKLFSLQEIIDILQNNALEEIKKLSEEEIEQNIYRIQYKIYENNMLEERKKAEKYLKNLKNVYEIVPNKVYVKGKKRNKPLRKNRYSFDISIRNKEGEIIIQDKYKNIHPSQTILGLQKALPYLYPKNPITLYVHPDFGYNKHSSLGNTLLIIDIKLEK